MATADEPPMPADTDARIRAALRRLLQDAVPPDVPSDSVMPEAALISDGLATSQKPAGSEPGDSPRRASRLTWLSDQQLRHAEASLWLAEQHGITSVPDALRWYVEQHGAAARSPVIPQAAEAFFRVKEAEGCGSRTMQAYRSTLGAFADAFRDRLPVDVSPDEISRYLEKWPNSTTRRGIWQVLVGFYAWCWRRKYVPKNPVLLLGKSPRVASSPRYVLTPAEASDLLRRTRDTDEIGYWTLSMFAGLRSVELYRLQKHPAPWSIIKREAGVIDLPEEISKTQGRIIPILPVLRPWLERLRLQNGRFFPRNHIPKNARLRAAVLAGRCPSGDPKSEAELLKSSNLGRHSFISYRLASAGASYAQVAMEVGNSEGVVRKFYQAVVSRSEAGDYFSLTPSRVARTDGAPARRRGRNHE